MSAFLGPIHHWLYNKIQLQEELIGTILNTAAQEGWDIPTVEGIGADGVNPALPPLEGSIDLGNIHGWLQWQIGLSEAKYAQLVSGLLVAGPGRISVLEKTAYAFGQRHSIDAPAGPASAYQALNDSLLDGMPCDQVNQITAQGEDSLSWKRTERLHDIYWTQAGGDAEVYYMLRSWIIAGMLDGSGVSFLTCGDGVFELRKKV